MNAAEVLGRARAAGVMLAVEGAKLRYRGDEAAVAEILDDLRANASAIIALISEHTPMPSAAEAVLAAATLLRGCTWEPEDSPCSFFTGHAGDAECRRCGGGWFEHFDAKPTA